MSFQQGQSHYVQELVPNYVVKSEYLPTNRVQDGHQSEAN